MFDRSFDNLTQTHYCEILQNDLMVEAWSALAAEEESLLQAQLSRSYKPGKSDAENLEAMRDTLQRLDAVNRFKSFLNYLRQPKEKGN